MSSKTINSISEQISELHELSKRAKSKRLSPEDIVILKDLIALAGLCNTQEPALRVPEIEACLGDLREKLLAEIQNGNSLNIFLLFVSTNLGELKSLLSSKQAACLVQNQLIELAEDQEESNYALYTKYLLFYHYETTSTICDSKPALSVGSDLAGISCLDLDVKNAGDLRNKFQKLEKLLSIQKNDLVSFTSSFKCLTLCLNQEPTSTIVLRDSIDKLLKQSYYELSMAIKTAKYPGKKHSSNIVSANQGTLLKHFDEVREEVDSGRLLYERARDYFAQVAYATTLTTSDHEPMYSPILMRSLVEEYGSQDRLENLRSVIDTIMRRLEMDHKFFRMNNRWIFSDLCRHLERFEGLFYVYADIHDLEAGTQRLTKNLQPLESLPIGNITPLRNCSEQYLDHSLSSAEFMTNCFALRAQSEELMNKWFKELSALQFFMAGRPYKMLYLHAADQVEGFTRNPSMTRRAFKDATKATGGQLSAGVAFVRICKTDLYDDLHRKAEFCVDVTKLFKGTGTAWESEQIWEKKFSQAKSNLALRLLNNKVSSGSEKDTKLLERISHSGEWWLKHLPENKTSQFEAILQASKRCSNDS